jgi:Ca-activated chloride channel family protein
VILATDGDLNVGITDDADLTKLIASKAGEGVFLTVLGFGTGNLKDAKMEKLADNGNGSYAYIDSVREAHKVLVDQMSGNLVTIAKDVKLQLEFNPKQVKSYRQIGYENRVLAAKDFDDDTKDAGEIGAGHTVTALYELVTSDAAADDKQPPAEPKKLKYQDSTSNTTKAPEIVTKLSGAADSDELLTLTLRYKEPDEDKSKRMEHICTNADATFPKSSGDFQFASSVASFAMLLRNSKHAGNATLKSCEEIASGSLGDDKHGYRSEFLDLVRKAQELK